MAIHDSDPERRNLVVLSIGFILFKLGRGKIDGTHLKLAMVNIEFSKPEIIITAAWLMLFWFLLRYWQTHKFSVFDSLKENAKKEFPYKFLVKYVEKRIDKPYNSDEFGFSNPRFDNQVNWKLKYTTYQATKKDSSGMPRSFSNASDNILDLSGPAFQLIRAWAYFYSAFSQPAFSSNAAPYLLFILAVLL